MAVPSHVWSPKTGTSALGLRSMGVPLERRISLDGRVTVPNLVSLDHTLSAYVWGPIKFGTAGILLPWCEAWLITLSHIGISKRNLMDVGETVKR